MRTLIPWGCCQSNTNLSQLKAAVRGCLWEIFVKPLSFKRHRFPAEVIRHAVWLYFRFSLSLRDVEELLAARGINSAMRRSGAGRLSSVLRSLAG